MCGVQDPESSNECHRICGLKCLPAAQPPAGKGEGAAHRTRTTPPSSSNAGSTSSAKSGNAGTPSRKSVGGQKRESRETEAVVRPPPYAEVAEEFSTLEAKATSSGMEDVSFHLEKARMAWIRAHASSKKGQQQDIRSFFDT